MATIYDLRTGTQMEPAAIRARCEEETRHLGKFEREAPYVPYYYEQALHGFAGKSECYCSLPCECSDRSCAACCAEDSGICECDSSWETYDVDADDVLIFPELKGRKAVRIYYSSDGFVSEVS